ncbi:hypothetical protein O1L68_35825 [Streptomyces lydicus]|nr:hypothetical protein [Streptomyces lydicus]
MAEQVREVVADRAVAVVQIGVAHPAGLHGHEHVARTGIGYEDRQHLDGGALLEGDDGAGFVRHVSLLGRRLRGRQGG